MSRACSAVAVPAGVAVGAAELFMPAAGDLTFRKQAAIFLHKQAATFRKRVATLLNNQVATMPRKWPGLKRACRFQDRRLVHPSINVRSILISATGLQTFHP